VLDSPESLDLLFLLVPLLPPRVLGLLLSTSKTLLGQMVRHFVRVDPRKVAAEGPFRLEANNFPPFHKISLRRVLMGA
jgi:hypothetical protein